MIIMMVMLTMRIMEDDQSDDDFFGDDDVSNEGDGGVILTMLTMDGKVLKWCCSFASMVMLRMISMLVEILIMVMLIYLHGATWASRPCTCSRPPVVCSHGNHYHGKIFWKLLDLEFCCQFVF